MWISAVRSIWSKSARQLPATLHIRPDMQLNSGVADIALASRAAGDARRWQGSLKTSNLRGFAAGRVIEFDQPLEVNFDVRQTASGPIIDQLIAQASFLKLEGRGGLADGGITANADLNQLVAELERIHRLGRYWPGRHARRKPATGSTRMQPAGPPPPTPPCRTLKWPLRA